MRAMVIVQLVQRLLKPVFDQASVISVRFPCLLLPLR